jgi:hypothetical protein
MGVPYINGMLTHPATPTNRMNIAKTAEPQDPSDPRPAKRSQIDPLVESATANALRELGDGDAVKGSAYDRKEHIIDLASFFASVDATKERAIIDPSGFGGYRYPPGLQSTIERYVAANRNRFTNVTFNGVSDKSALKFLSRVFSDYWRECYTFGYSDGMTAGFDEGVNREPTKIEIDRSIGSIPPENSEGISSPTRTAETFDTQARSVIGHDAFVAGWKHGNEVGVKAKAIADKYPKAIIPGTPINYKDDPDDQDTDADTEDSLNSRAQPLGENDYVKSRGGHRIVLQEGEDMILDSRAVGKIRVQGSNHGVRITAGGAAIDVLKDGEVAKVVVNAASVEIAGSTAKAVLGDAVETWLKSHTHGYIPGPSGSAQTETSALSTDGILSEKVKLA